MSEGKGKRSFQFTVILPLILLFIVLGIFLWPEAPQGEAAPPLPAELPFLAPLGSRPDWSQLDRFQRTITRGEFLRRLDQIYAKGGGWKRWIASNSDFALLDTGGKTYALEFAKKVRTPPGAIFPWKRRGELSQPALFSESPLAGLHIALDPGHIGGEFAEIEERHLNYGDHEPIEEGTMTLLTAQHLKKRLESLGAKVSLVREKNEPVTELRPGDFTDRDRKSAEKLFYRTAEIRARAELVNQVIQPDLVLCLHYNASGSPVALPGQNFHIILNGAYHASEVAREDERFEMLQHLLAGTIDEELPLARKMTAVFLEQTKLPIYEYRPNHPYATKLGEAIWARNLLANRLYQCPVIFLEPYTMNSTEFIARYRAGDYPGLRLVDGEMRRSVYREYAKAVADGLVAYYRER